MQIYVGNLPFTITAVFLTALFAAHGTVQRVKMIMDRDPGLGRGVALVAVVTMGTHVGGDRAILALNGRDCQGRALTVGRGIARPWQKDRPERPR
jgi:RNA recognition motif-containing protein